MVTHDMILEVSTSICNFMCSNLADDTSLTAGSPNSFTIINLGDTFVKKIFIFIVQFVSVTIANEDK